VLYRVKRQTCAFQQHRVDGTKIEVRPACPAISGQQNRQTGILETFTDLRRDLVAAPADARPQSCSEFAHVDTVATGAIDSGRGNTGDGPAPAGVDDGRPVIARRNEQERHTVGSAHPAEQPRSMHNQSVRLELEDSVVTAKRRGRIDLDDLGTVDLTGYGPSSRWSVGPTIAKAADQPFNAFPACRTQRPARCGAPVGKGSSQARIAHRGHPGNRLDDVGFTEPTRKGHPGTPPEQSVTAVAGRRSCDSVTVLSVANLPPYGPLWCRTRLGTRTIDRVRPPTPGIDT